MDDIRKIDYNNKLKRRANISVLLHWSKNNWFKIVVLIGFICIIFYPDFVGSIIGEWFNKIATSFIEKLTF